MTAAVKASDYEHLLLKNFRPDNADPAKADEYRQAVTFRETTTVDEVVAALKKHGVAIFPAIYEPERLERVRNQYDRMMLKDHEHAMRVDAREDTDTFLSRGLYSEGLPVESYDEIHALFGSSILEHISSQFFSGQAFDFNTSFYCQWTKQTDTPASGILHWDKQLR